MRIDDLPFHDDGMEFDEPDQTAKADAGKLDLTLVPPTIIEEIAKVRTFGTLRYGSADNWKKISIDRYWKATLRHILAAWNDLESIDDESGLMHISHACCNLAFILDMLKVWHELEGKEDGTFES